MWKNIKELDSWIKKINHLTREEKWAWIMNTKLDAKYINMKIDMRDGSFYFHDNRGKLIEDIEHLEFQYDKKKKN